MGLARVPESVSEPLRQRLVAARADAEAAGEVADRLSSYARMARDEASRTRAHFDNLYLEAVGETPLFDVTPDATPDA